MPGVQGRDDEGYVDPAVRVRGEHREGGGAKREGGGAPPLESAAGLATLLGLRSSDELSTEQASQLLLSRYLLAIGTLVIVCLLVI